MDSQKLIRGLLACALIAGLAGCGSSSAPSTQTTPSAQTGSVFLAGTDAPLPSILSFQVQVTSVTLSDGTGTPVSILNGPQTIDFARFDGLKTLLDFNAVPAGTYTTVNVSLANPVLAYLNTSQPGAPTISNVPNPSLTNSNLTIMLAAPFTVTAGQNIGLKMDFNLHNSIQVDGTGQVTGVVNPNINFTVLTPGTPDAEIDEFNASVVSVNASANSFVVQGPHGRQYTVLASSTTEWENNDSIASLVPNQTIVTLSGQFDPSSQTLDASDIAVLSQSGFYAGGLLTYVNPASGAATNFNMYVRSTLPTGTGITLGQIANVNLTGTEKFYIFRRHTPFSQFVFNSSMMIPGQHVTVGGPASGAANAQSLSVERVVLHPSGISGTVVAGSVDPSTSSFQMTADGLKGILFNGPVTVYLTGDTGFRFGFHGIGDLQNAGTASVRVVGFVLKDPTTDNPIILGKFVDDKHAVDQGDANNDPPEN
ncbi:MAG TPA: DUF4382 domain-containing protein [Acidobacteriaceae bacterium]|nr:DUF4382 domain-containing protein [Acidobacteriaceae bacterium]